MILSFGESILIILVIAVITFAQGCTLRAV